METTGVEQPHVMKGTSTGSGGGGVATSDHKTSFSWWVGMNPVSKSVNASIVDLSSGDLNADSTLGHAPADNGELSPLMGRPLPTEIQGEKPPPEATLTREHLTLVTDVPVVADAAIAGPTTAGSPHEGGEGGDEGEGGEVGRGKLVDDEWGTSGKQKSMKGKCKHRARKGQ